MGSIFNVREIHYASEGSLAEYAETLNSLTWSRRIPVDSVDVEFEQPRFDDKSIQARQNESRGGHLGPRTGFITLNVKLCGHNAATTGALTETWLQDLLSDGLGGGNVAQAGGVVQGAGISATDLGNTQTATLVSGGLVRVGAKGDARADGQGAAVSTSAGALLTALPAAPIATDVIYAAQVAYPSETLGATKRFLVAFMGTDEQWAALGCQLAGVTFGLRIGEEPTVALRYRVAYWASLADATLPWSLPSYQTLQSSFRAPFMAAGSVFFGDTEVTTRTVVQPTEIGLSIDMGLAENMTPGGAGTFQTITSYARTRSVPTLTLTLPSYTTVPQTLYNTDGNEPAQFKQVLITGSTRDKRSILFYFPKMYPVGPAPTFTEVNEQVGVTLTLRGTEGNDATNELTQSAWRLGMA